MRGDRRPQTAALKLIPSHYLGRDLLLFLSDMFVSAGVDQLKQPRLRLYSYPEKSSANVSAPLGLEGSETTRDLVGFF